VLVGLPGTGKTTTGRRLAARLDVTFADSDVLVEQRTGRRVVDIFAADGESAFRALEAEVIRDALTGGFEGILALGGGAVTVEANRVALKASGVPVVLLRSSIRTLSRRVGTGASRPLLAGDPRGRLVELARERDPLYREVATLVVDTDRRSSARVCAELVDLLGVHVSGKSVSG